MKKIWFLIFSIAFFFSNTKLANAVGFDLGNLGNIDLPSSRFANAEELILAIINWILSLGGALAVIAIVYSGIMYMMAGADETKAETAKKNLIWAITGVVIIILALIIIAYIGNIIK